MDLKVRELLDKIKVTTSAAAEMAGRAAASAGKKAGEAVEVTKLNLKVYELNGEIDGLYREIGRIVYRTHGGEEVSDEEIERLLASVDEKQAETAELRKKIGSTKRVVKCVHCGKECDMEDDFCRACGAPL